jgi:hypothetical protein
VIELQSQTETGLELGDLVREHQAMVFGVCWHLLHDRGTTRPGAVKRS